MLQICFKKYVKVHKIYLETVRLYREGGRTVGSGVVKEILE